ncbi:MAG: hypothetical protein FWG42_09960, partial [Clostridiales bacterium]|nr:hypothetical protein [Clostridiales bacterium]
MNTYINSKRGKTFKMLVAAFAVLALVAGIVLVPGTFAADEDITEVLQAPNGLTAIEVGETFIMSISNINEAATTDTTIASLTTNTNFFDNVHITGVSAGGVGGFAG